MALFKFLKKSKTPEIGKQISWSESIKQVFRVIDFDRNGTLITSNGDVKAKSTFKPYGYLVVRTPLFDGKIRLPIIHRDDFLLASSVFDDPQFSAMLSDHELLVTYVPKEITPRGLAGINHALHYVIVPSGTLVKYHENNNINDSNLELLFNQLKWEGLLQVQINKNPKL